MAVPRHRAFSFYLSSDINLPVQVRVSDLQVLTSQIGPVPAPAALYVSVWVAEAGELRCQPVRTTYVEGSLTGAVWGEWLQLPLKYRDLACGAVLCAAVWRIHVGEPADTPQLVGGTTLPLFSRKGRLRTGPQLLKVWEGREPCMVCPTTTPGLSAPPADGPTGDPALHVGVPHPPPPAAHTAPGSGGGAPDPAVLRHRLTQLGRGDLPRVPWLDPLTAAQVSERWEGAASVHAASAASAAVPPSWHLVLDLPWFPCAVLYQQPAGHVSLAGASVPVGLTGSAGGARTHGLTPWRVTAPGADTNGGPGGAGLPSTALAPTTGTPSGLLAGLVCLLDPEVGRDNPSELKAQKLARSLVRGLIDRDLKPNTEERRRISALLRAPPNKPLTAEEHALLWRFRFALQQEHRALPKFLQVVDWRDSGEVRQAQELLSTWAPATTADALELLSPTFAAIDEVRGHAVSILSAKEDDELLTVLLQLVQALRYESSDVSRLSRLLVTRAAANPHFAITLHWYLATEVQDPSFGGRADAVLSQLYRTLQSPPPGTASQGAGLGRAVCDAIRGQRELLAQLKHVVSDLKSLRLKAARATQRMQELISASGACGELTTLRVPLPLDPSLTLAGVIPSECFAFKSAQLPLRLHFRVEPTQWAAPPHSPAPAHPAAHPHPHGHSSSAAQPHAGPGQHGGGSGASSGHLTAAQQLSALPSRTAVVVHGDELRCCLIYKKGDDLRQDQFVLQMIGLMDTLLKRDNLDLRMTPYKVLPTGPDDGLVEFVPSTPLSRVLAEHRTIRRFLALHGGEDPQGPLGVRPEVLETFVRSAAGASVATYILGVGDRHLDNLLLAPDGRLFHIDFGYILGADPKPFPPPMKICKEMVEAMGGQDSVWYAQFRTYACEAYNILRKNADLMLSLFHLMEGSAIEALRGDPEKALLKLQDKLRLDLDDEAAVAWMTGLLMESATALMPQIVETTHRWAQYWR